MSSAAVFPAAMSGEQTVIGMAVGLVGGGDLDFAGNVFGSPDQEGGRAGRSRTAEEHDNAPAVSDTLSAHNAVPTSVEGLDHHYLDESRALLRSRLTAIASVVCVGLALYFVRALFLQEPPVPWLRSCVLINSIGILAVLVSRQLISFSRLRWMELQLIVPTCYQLSFIQVVLMLEAARQRDAGAIVYVTLFGAMGMACMMLCYALFMPNGWRRTVATLSLMATAPIAATLIARSYDAFIQTAIPVWYEWEMGLVLAAVAGVGVWGTVTIASLRKEVQKAQQLGQYDLKRLLDAGGMGHVYLAEHRLLKRPCAVKLIHTDQGADPLALARFRREVHSTARLTHWNTVEVYDYGQTPSGTFYYVMEYLPGMNLAKLVHRFGPLSVGRTLHLMRQTCSALREAHEMGVVHRDLKPANIYATTRGGIYDVAKLLDFGLAAGGIVIPDADAEIEAESQKFFAGSPAFMAPEQSNPAIQMDARSDIYSFGASTYFLLTGRPPFSGNNPVQLMAAHLNTAPTPPSELVSTISPELERIVLKCLAKSPDDRYQSARDLEHDLAACPSDDEWAWDNAEVWWQTNVPEIDASVD